MLVQQITLVGLFLLCSCALVAFSEAALRPNKLHLRPEGVLFLFAFSALFVITVWWVTT